MSFDSIPILDLEEAKDPSTKPKFLELLRHALLEVGFLYLKNVGIPDELTQQVITEAISFFELPMEEKLRIEMKNAPSFLGYSRLNAEITAHTIDHREQIDLSTDHAIRTPDQPLYRNLLAPTQWPSPSLLPSFKLVYSDYISRMGAISIFFTSLIAEAIGLPATAFNKYFDAEQQHKLKVVKYPDLKELGLWKEGEAVPEGQGVGPHKDSMLTSYLLQVTKHRGLQVQNLTGEWIDCPPVDGTLVVAIGQGMEALTQGVCMSTTHRVLSPAPGTGARISVPFFQGVSLDAQFDELNDWENGGGVGCVPEAIKEMRRRVVARNGGRLDDVEFTFSGGNGSKTLGEATLKNRVKSHPDVGERWYPDILAGIREQQKRERVEAEEKTDMFVSNRIPVTDDLSPLLDLTDRKTVI
ncbi:2OG-Fe(II) oxygenase superfamily protein [Drepanopeziza brunnea f. sp. 'multigermtubi' MB_m1]|uniref:2OG-Fe(II) oxygenase superfamily protein n=1 Tax=Marssonina brunnea f. sp. multigermtubi (strain MB_m1) TaxID=1072389 RepID=K1Y0A6_MARBU|nr:2OG-Fe(II) oxygenase superfamily protein [Drepanopeziza brunnea f. sp. 'multigermtubi' MB_m1]EKD18539.1 2OG-Fe(II) oxygenase superfamily protein [Drepanopeziza brunnea f. sp. 'multigermtubi' MB_m1]